jgi:DNA-binding protein HU-beta
MRIPCVIGANALRDAFDLFTIASRTHGHLSYSCSEKGRRYSKAASPRPLPRGEGRRAPVVTLKAVFGQLGEAHGLPKKQALSLLADLVAAMTTHLKQGDRIRMSGPSILEVRARAARTGRNPATGETIQIKARKKVGFRPAKELKETI